MNTIIHTRKTQTARFILNDQSVELQLSPGKNALDFLRRDRGLFGTKEGCREGECGACTVVLGRMPVVPYRAVPSCLLSSGQLSGTHLVTIEGLDLGKPNRLQQAFIDEGASQCGFCTPGFIMALSGYLMSGRTVSLKGAMDSLDGNICRCTGYASIRRAVEFTVGPLLGTVPAIETLIELELLPPYFADISRRLSGLQTDHPGGPDDASVEHQFAVPDEAVAIAPGADSPLLLSGGTDLYVRHGDAIGKIEPRFLVPESSPITRSAEEILIPATASMEQIRLDEGLNAMFPGLDEKMLLIASHILRNRATVAGNLVNASPIADSAVLLLAADARLTLRSPGGKQRSLALRDFYLGYKKLDLEDGEMLVDIRIDAPEVTRNWNFCKTSKRERLDIASCNSAAVFQSEPGGSPATGSGESLPIIVSASLAFGGVAPVPYTARNTMAYLEGKPACMATFREAFAVLQDEIAPIADVRGSGEYKRALASAQLAEHFMVCFPEHCSFADFQEGGLL